MNPLRIRATNLRSFPSIDWRIPEGIAAIVGPNGAGKSTLLGAIELALFADGSRDLAPALGPFDDKLTILMEFEHDGEEYRVRRTYSKGKATLDLERPTGKTDPQYWHPISRESVRETQALLEETLGLSRQTFNAAAFLAQGNAAAFCEAAPSERKAILGAILDPRGLWPGLAQRALTERKSVEDALTGIEIRAIEREKIAEQAPELTLALGQSDAAKIQAASLYDLATRALEDAQAELADNAAAAERAKTAEAVVDATTKTCEIAQQHLDMAKANADQLAPAQAALATLETQAAQIPTLEQKESDQRARVTAWTLAAEKNASAERLVQAKTQERHTAQVIAKSCADSLYALDERIGVIEGTDDHERCTLCHQELGADARAATLTNLNLQRRDVIESLANARDTLALRDEELRQAELEAGIAKIPEHVNEIDYASELAAARRAEQERAGLAVRIETYEAAAERIPTLTQALRDAELELARTSSELTRAYDEMLNQDDLEAAVAAARITASNRRVDLDEANSAHTRAQAALDNAKQAAAELDDLNSQNALLQKQLDTLKLAERSCGRDGIPALIAENTCATIESEANRVLERIPTASGTTFRLEIRTQRALKSDTAALRETLEILVSDRQTTREFATFSGGERFRVAFALRWSLARLLANRRGAESRLLVIDEPDGLDAGGMDGLAAVLREEAGGFAKILVVSHNSLLASAFEQVVEIESDGEISRIKEAI